MTDVITKPELQSWQQAEIDLLESKVEAIEGAIMGLSRIDAMFKTSELANTVMACRNLLAIEADNMRKRIARLQ